jgi:hypothetical protein
MTYRSGVADAPVVRDLAKSDFPFEPFSAITRSPYTDSRSNCRQRAAVRPTSNHINFKKLVEHKGCYTEAYVAPITRALSPSFGVLRHPLYRIANV